MRCKCKAGDGPCYEPASFGDLCHVCCTNHTSDSKSCPVRNFSRALWQAWWRTQQKGADR